MAERWLQAITSFTYGAVSTAVTPFLKLQLLSRKARGEETDTSLAHRWGHASEARPDGSIVWFHAVGIGECAVALPLILRCLEEHEDVYVVLTTSTVEAHDLLSAALPPRVSLQFSPVETPRAVNRFLDHWAPRAAIFVETELWPNLLWTCRARRIPLAMLNASISSSAFVKWHRWSVGRAFMAELLQSFSLIVPQNETDVARFRLLGAQLWQMPGWCADLQYAAAMGACVWRLWSPPAARVQQLKQRIAGRAVWVAASTREGEETAVAQVHAALTGAWPRLLTIIVPRVTSRCSEIAIQLRGEGLRVALWSALPTSLEQLDVVLVDASNELPLLFTVSEIAFVGGSLFEGSRGHSLAEAAVAGCAVVVGPYAGNFSLMAEELNEAAVAAAREAETAAAARARPATPTPYQSSPSHRSRRESAFWQRHDHPSTAAREAGSWRHQLDDLDPALRRPLHGHLHWGQNSPRRQPQTAPAAFAHTWEFGGGGDSRDHRRRDVSPNSQGRWGAAGRDAALDELLDSSSSLHLPEGSLDLSDGLGAGPSSPSWHACPENGGAGPLLGPATPAPIQRPSSRPIPADSGPSSSSATPPTTTANGDLQADHPASLGGNHVPLLEPMQSPFHWVPPELDRANGGPAVVQNHPPAEPASLWHDESDDHAVDDDDIIFALEGTRGCDEASAAAVPEDGGLIGEYPHGRLWCRSSLDLPPGAAPHNNSKDSLAGMHNGSSWDVGPSSNGTPTAGGNGGGASERLGVSGTAGRAWAVAQRKVSFQSNESLGSSGRVRGGGPFGAPSDGDSDDDVWERHKRARACRTPNGANGGGPAGVDAAAVGASADGGGGLHSTYRASRFSSQQDGSSNGYAGTDGGADVLHDDEEALEPAASRRAEMHGDEQGVGAAPAEEGWGGRPPLLQREDAVLGSAAGTESSISLKDYMEGQGPETDGHAEFSGGAESSSDLSPLSRTTPMSSTAAVDNRPNRTPWHLSAPHFPPRAKPCSGAAGGGGGTSGSGAGPGPGIGDDEASPGGSPYAEASEARAEGFAGPSHWDVPLRYEGEYILPATHLPSAPHGPAVWRVEDVQGLADAVATLLREPLERRSRGHAAAQAAAQLAAGLVATVAELLNVELLDAALHPEELMFDS